MKSFVTVAKDRSKERDEMVRAQIEARGVVDERVLAAMRAIPREAFIAYNLADDAYADGPQTIGCGQTISQPYIVALMLEMLELKPTDRVLEIGTGTGYQASVLGKLVQTVYTLERIEDLAQRARPIIASLGLTNVHVVVGDGTLGYPQQAPYDAIIVAAAGPFVPPALIEQLAPSGRLVIPVGERYTQDLIFIRKSSDGTKVDQESRSLVSFVPLIGQQGWNA